MIVAQRTLWSLVALAVLVSWKPLVRGISDAQREGKSVLGWHALSGVLLASNWLLYVWATLNGRILEGALGYYLNPFFNMLFGYLWFGERHTRRQKQAIALALAGTAVQFPAAGVFPWISLVLAVTFSLYAVVRKRAPLDGKTGLVVETAMMAPVALGWLVVTSPGIAAAFGGTPGNMLLVIGSGLVTALPLLFFGHAARTIPLGTLGMLQFLGPTLQFLIGWRIYGETLGAGRAVSFALIWLAIGLYLAEMHRISRSGAIPLR